MSAARPGTSGVSNTSSAARLLGEFRTADDLIAAVTRFRGEGYDATDTFTPFDLPELDAATPARRSPLGWVAAGGGAAGLVASYGIQWWANVHAYPLNVGGRPVHAVPAFVLVTFEGTVLGAALAVCIGLLVILRLPRLWAPEDEIDGFERASIDRFWVATGPFANEQDRDTASALLRSLGALRTVVLESR
jgi:hypothetical protein